MGLQDRDYMREAPRLHVGETHRPGQPPPQIPRGGTYSPGGQSRGSGGFARQIIVTVVGMVVFAVIASLLGWRMPWGSLITITHSQPQQAQPVASGAPKVEWGVHLCAPQDYSAKDLACRRDLHAVLLAHIARVHLSVTGPNAASFTASTLDASIDRQSASDGYVNVGATHMTVGLSYNVAALPLDQFFANAAVSPSRGVYHIEVDEGTTLLGATTIRLL